MVSSRSRLSREVRRLDRVVGSSAATGVVGFIVGGFVVALVIAGFPESWEVAFSTVAAAVTLVMVFVLHHAQRREQATTQLKLDEIVRAIRRPTTTTCTSRPREDDELRELEERHIEQHHAARAD